MMEGRDRNQVEMEAMRIAMRGGMIGNPLSSDVFWVILLAVASLPHTRIGVCIHAVGKPGGVPGLPCFQASLLDSRADSLPL